MKTLTNLIEDQDNCKDYTKRMQIIEEYDNLHIKLTEMLKECEFNFESAKNFTMNEEYEIVRKDLQILQERINKMLTII